MECRWIVVLLLVAAVDGRGKKHRHNKPGRALLDRLRSTTVGDITIVRGAGSELLPAPLDAAPFSVIEANATCGYDGAEEYCRDTPGKRGIVCDVCEGLDGSSSRRHPATHAVDGAPDTWWQSPTFATGDEFRHVEMVITLPDKMELLHVIIKSGPSPRPLAWSLEVSTLESGEDWRMIKAFGDREHCKNIWDLRPERRRRKARGVKRINRSEKPTCSTVFASPRPLENGEMHVGMGEGVTAHRMRLAFRAAHPMPSNQQYYTVRGLTLAARCLCHGHAERCHVNSKGAKCECLHGTCGTHCQRCCSGLPSSPGQPCEDYTEDKTDCSCGNRGACTYDDSGAILCVNCTDNRAGPLCDRCLFGFYNEFEDGPCLPCTCNPDGSDGECTFNKEIKEVTCNCYPSYTGQFCERCVDDRAVFPECQVINTTPACKCDPRGTIGDLCDEVCQCKTNVVGERCDACAPGHFGLSEMLPEGCKKCYCSHVTDSCAASDENINRIGTIIIPLTEGWQVTDIDNQETLDPSVDDQGKLYLISYEVEGWDSFYWLTKSLNSERLSLYGRDIKAKLFWGIVRGDTGGNPSVEPDVILLGGDGTKLLYGNRSHNTPGELELTVPFVEGEWYKMDDQAFLADRTEFMDVLRDLKAVMIRAHFHGDQDEVRLEDISFRPSPLTVVEQCSCGGGYSGPHCETCAWSHARLPALSLAGFLCVPCDCNGHANCDSVDGPCGPCQQNTTGQHCERCLPGHYGNPVQGACKPCACPLFEASNNFSPNCALASAEGDDYACTQCPEGYAGDHCEVCDYGFFGDPLTPGGRCVPCECGGAPCHRDTGECVSCPPHTEGINCDQCQEGYWLDTSQSSVTCIPCACGAGALSGACERGGSCACRPAWGGNKCDRCKEGYGGITSGCPPCSCGIASLNNSCDADTGACVCAEGAAPPSCDGCLDEYYGIHAGGCKGCNCSSKGAESNACDIRTGQCRCKPHVKGRACDTCEESYWGLYEGGCRRCNCGAGAAACDPVTGACACAVGVGGRNCDICLPGYYGFGPAGCLPCPPCSDGKVCSPDSGRCVCPARSHGVGCKLCSPGYWARNKGCKPCTCGLGAVSNTCDPHTGSCKCKSGWTGPQCDVCAEGHFGPRCRPCGCHLAGSLCEQGVCKCDYEGRCDCKQNVVGDKCDSCLDGTFGLSPDNPTGCTACFCFGRSAHCAQAQVTRAAIIHHVPRHVTLLVGDNVRSVDQASLLAIHTHSPEVTISLPWPPVPVYMDLDKRFLGDRVTSYGGALRFTVEEEGGVELPAATRVKFPLVRLFAKDIVLDYDERIPPTNGTHTVRFHESLWAVRGTERSGRASRPALMLALAHVERIMIRVTTRYPTHEDKVHALLLNVSLDTAIPGLSRSEPALGVELCDCPRGYSANSCQEPAVGFWFPATKVHMSNVAGTIVISLEGGAQPCHCNGRAVACDALSGDCLNCTGGTGGPRCAACAAGHHGAPDSALGCQPCPCPSKAKNFAEGCGYIEGRLQCKCKTGYAGRECEACASGFHRSPDGSCLDCACNDHGSISPYCDVRGRCRCKPFASGMKCDQCVARRTFLSGDGCTPCDNCTQTLLNSVEDLANDLHRRADLTELSRIPKPYPALLEFAHNTSVLVHSLNVLKKELKNPMGLEPLISKLEELKQRVSNQADRLKSEAMQREKEAQFLSLESMSSLEEVLKEKAKLGEIVAALDEFARGERHLTAHKALKEARHLLRRIKDMNMIDYVAGANDVFDTANLQSTAVHEYKYRVDDSSRRVQKLRSKVEQWESKYEDVKRLADVVWSAGDNVAAGSVRVKPRLAAARDVALRCRLIMEDVTNLSPHNLTIETSNAILHARSLMPQLPTLAETLETFTKAAEEKEGILYNLTPAYKEKYLKPVQEHVKMLGEKAKEYKSLFAGTRAVASSGVSAAHAWGEVAANVRLASELATSAVSAASRAAAMARGPVPLTNTAKVTMKSSEELKNKGAAVLAKAEELRTQLEHLRRNADLVSVILRGLGWQERELGLRPKARVADILTMANEQADRVFATTRVLYDEASEVRRRVRYNLRRQLAELQKHGDTALGAVQEHVSQIRGNTVRGAEVAAALEAAAESRAKEHETASTKISPALQLLKDTVAKARHAADSISVSLSSGPSLSCGRLYRPPRVFPSRALTRLAAAMSFDRAVSNGPVLTVLDHSQEIQKYLKLSVEDKKFLLSWDLGGGEGVISHPELLQPAHDDGDHTSYRIEIQRVWNTVHLTVERAGHTPITVVNSTSSSFTSLLASEVWLGRNDDDTSPPRDDITDVGDVIGLPGCVHALYVDDATVGLWNFVKQPKDAQCTGCTQRWYTSSRGGESLPWFSGSGYAEVRRSGLRPSDRRQFSIALTFKTRDQDALLFMALDTENNRSVSIVLRGCRVVFAVQYTGSRLEIVSPSKHCSGKPAHVQAIRVFAGNKLERGSLRVNGEETLGSPSPPIQSASSLPSLSGRYWVGGAPPGPAPAAAPAPPLLGCLGGLTVDREGYDLMSTPTRHGVESKCGSRTLRSAILEGAGFIELPSPLLRRKAALGLSFLARAPNGVLLYRAPFLRQDNEVSDDEDEDHKHYLAVILVGGELEVIAAAGKAEMKLRTNGTKFDDGHMHTLRIVRAHKQLELWVDESPLASGNLQGNAFAARIGGLYLGGVENGDPRITVPPFTGTIADVIVDSTLIGFETAVKWKGAQLGRADSEIPAERNSEPRALQAEPDNNLCTKTSSYTVEAGAVKFGDAPFSHATLRLPPKAKELMISLQFRTFNQDGLILLIPGSKAKPKHYVALVVREGKLKLIVRGRRRKEISLTSHVSDGVWRPVSVSVSRGRASLSLGAGGVSGAAPPAARAPRLYVGGVSPPPALPHLPNSIIRIGGFRGCIRRVSVNGRSEDLVRDAQAHHRVTQCFPNIEQGAYFAGDAYAMWSSTWSNIGGSEVSTEVRLQFRTAEPSGVLLATREFVLELKDGVVVLTRSSGGTETSRTEARGIAAALCDNTWHSVSGHVGRASLSVSLDAGPELKGLSTESLLDDATEGGGMPLYIGGVPDGLPEAVEGRENFKGCIRDVTIGGHKKDWPTMEALHNVLLDSCPVVS